jgi:LmbE family N-acetylglucosaminyl deacetylase
MLGAHPDDSEICAGGTAIKWAAAGAEVLNVSISNGDAGHQSEGGGALARRRADESRRSAKILGVSWRTLDFHDGGLVPSIEVREAVIRAIREWKADIVISHRPNDYHPDHRYAGMVMQDAAYLVAVPNICPGTPRLAKNPVFMYFMDEFQKPQPFRADVAVDVSDVIGGKFDALHQMDSQMYEWLPWMDDRQAEVPADDAGRRQWLETYFGPDFTRWTDKHRDALADRYGDKHAAGVKFAEYFELCEYGRQPSREQLWEMFPR